MPSTTYSGMSLLFVSNQPLTPVMIHELQDTSHKKLPLATSTLALSGSNHAVTGTAVVGTGSKYLTELAVGSKIFLTGALTTYGYIASITDDTHCTLVASGLATGATMWIKWEWKQIFYDEEVAIDISKKVMIQRTAREGKRKIVQDEPDGVKMSFELDDIALFYLVRMLQINPSEFITGLSGHFVSIKENVGYDLSANGLVFLVYKAEFDASNLSDIPKLGTGGDTMGWILFNGAPAANIKLSFKKPQLKIPVEIETITRDGSEAANYGLYGGMTDLSQLAAST